MQEGLCHDLWQKPLPGSRRIAIIDDADALNEECSNALLKTLEEPPPGAVVFLIGTHAERQLPTIRSRSQIIRFQPLATDVVARLLLQQGRAADLAEAQCLAQRSGGSLDEAAIEAVGQFEQFRDRWLGLLARCPLDSLAAAKMAIAFADEAGKEASARRQRLRQVIDATVEFCTALLRHQVGSAPGVALSAAVEHAAKSWPADDELALRCAERSHQAGEQLDRFVNPATLVECWLDDLAREQTLVLR